MFIPVPPEQDFCERPMPTAAKLAAAILFGALAWWVSLMIVPLVFPGVADVGPFAEYNAAIGVVVGWQVAGGRARTTWPNAVAYGLTAALAMTFTALFLQSSAKMVGQSFSGVYEGPSDALLDVIRMMVSYFQLIATPDVMGTLLVGGIMAGLVTEWVARNYR